jgi:hypothetical protein
VPADRRHPCGSRARDGLSRTITLMMDSAAEVRAAGVAARRCAATR